MKFFIETSNLEQKEVRDAICTIGAKILLLTLENKLTKEEAESLASSLLIIDKAHKSIWNQMLTYVKLKASAVENILINP